MKTIHLQVWISPNKVAEIAKALHNRGSYAVKQADILKACVNIAHQALNPEPMSTDEAIAFLKQIGYSSVDREEQQFNISAKAGKAAVARAELEELIKRIGQGPSSPDEIREMFSLHQIKEEEEKKNESR
jgi:hypothetical protein